MSWNGSKKDHEGYTPQVFDYREKFDNITMANAGRTGHAADRTLGGTKWGVDLISLHCTAGMSEVKGESFFNSIIGIDAWKNANASSTFAVSGYGDVGIIVDLDKRPYTTSTSSVDKRAYTFEIASEPSGSIKMTNYALNAVVETLAWLMKSGKFKGPLIWLGEKENSNGYLEGPYRAIKGYDPTNVTKYGVNSAGGAREFNDTNVKQQNVVIHRWFGTGGKICPGWYFTERLGYLLDQANRLAGFSTNNAANDITQHPKVSDHNTWTYTPINLNFNNIQTATPYTENEMSSVLENPVNSTVAAGTTVKATDYRKEASEAMADLDLSTKRRTKKKGTILGTMINQK